MRCTDTFAIEVSPLNTEALNLARTLGLLAESPSWRDSEASLSSETKLYDRNVQQ